MALLELTNLNKYYPSGDGSRFQALKDVSLSMETGELVSVIGESGSGKSTLMNLIGGLDTDFEGSIRIGDQQLDEMGEKQLSDYHKYKVGFVFQSFNLIPHLSVLDNVTMAMTLSNVGKEARRKQAHHTLSILGLEDQINKQPNQLSGGQKQRVAIARALVNNPDIIIADEPTGSLDSETSDQVLEIFQQIAASGKLVLMVTHSERVAAVCSRIITIADGAIINDEYYPERLEAINSKNFERGKMAQVERPKKGNLSLGSAIILSLKNMLAKWPRNTMIAVGGSIGIMSIILMLALGAGIDNYLRETMQSQVNPLVSEVRMPPEDEEAETPGFDLDEAGGDMPTGGNMPGGGDLPGGGGMPQEAGPPAFLFGNPSFPAENIAELEDIEGVTDLEEGYTLFSFSGQQLEADDSVYPFITLTTVSSLMRESDLNAGAFPQTGEIMVTRGLAEQIADSLTENNDNNEDSQADETTETEDADPAETENAEADSQADPEEIEGQEAIGETVTVQLNIEGSTLTQDFVISGIYTDAGDAGSPSSLDGIYLNFDDLENMAADQDTEILPNAVYLVAADSESSEAIRAQVDELGYQGSIADSLTDIFSEMIDIFTYVLIGVAALSLIVSAIMILTVLYISVVERTQEIGVLQAIGARRKDIRRIFVSEAFLTGLFSGLVGVGLSYIISFFGNQWMNQQFGVAILDYRWEYAAAGLAVSIIISTIAGLYPSSKAAKLDPVEALRAE